MEFLKVSGIDLDLGRMAERLKAPDANESFLAKNLVTATPPARRGRLRLRYGLASYHPVE